MRNSPDVELAKSHDSAMRMQMGKVSGAMQREDWNMIVKMAREPVSSKLVTTAKVGFGGGTALHMASYCHKLDVSMVLIDAGADLTAQDKEGYTPLHIAALSGAQTVAELLLARGADVGATNAYGWTPLHAASVNGHIHVALFLIARGGKVDAPAKDGRTPAAIAASSGRGQMSRLLKQAAEEVPVLPQKRRAVESPLKKDTTPQGGGLAAISRRKKFEQDMADDGNEGLDDEEDDTVEDECDEMDVTDDDNSILSIGVKRQTGKTIRLRKQSDTKALPRSRWTRRTSSQKLNAELADGEPAAVTGGENGDATLISPVAVRNGENTFGDHTRHMSKPLGEKATAMAPPRQDLVPSPGLPVLPPAPMARKNLSESKGLDSPQKTSLQSPDIGKLSVPDVADLMVQYVCEGHDEQTTNRFSAKVRKGVMAYRLSGRALLAQEPPASDLARAILLGQHCVGERGAPVNLDHDVLYFLVIDFIRLARLRTSSSFAFDLSRLSRSMRDGERTCDPQMSSDDCTIPNSVMPKFVATNKARKEPRNANLTQDPPSATAHVIRSAKKMSRDSGSGK